MIKHKGFWPSYVHGRAEIKARVIVKEALRRQGEKLSQYWAKDITQAARDYVANHPELLMEASSEVILELTKLRQTARAQGPKTAEKSSV